MSRTEAAAMPAQREYVAFISYRHKPYDMAVAKKTHALIERYRVPRALRGSRGKRLGIAFRDQDELPVSGDLSLDICRALDHAEYLIVICTPNTPESIWVGREIEYFLRHHQRSHVLAVLASGDPDTSFPYALTHLGDEKDTVVEPLAANICADTERESLRLLNKESIRLFAAMLGCPYDSLVRREQKRRQKRLFSILGVALAVLIGYVGILLRSNRTIEAKNQELEAVNGALEAVNLELESKNQDLETMNQSLIEQKRALQITESSYLTAHAEAALAEGDQVEAIDCSVAALPKPGDDRPYYAPAESTLMRALEIFGPQVTKSVFAHSIAVGAPVRLFQPVEDGGALLVLDEYGVLYSYQALTGEMNWRFPLSTAAGPSSSAGEAVMTWDGTNQTVYVLCGGELLAIDGHDGKVVWRTGSERRYMQFSKNEADNTIVAVENTVTDLMGLIAGDLSGETVVLDAATGAEKQRWPWGQQIARAQVYRGLKPDKERRNTAFTKDGSGMAGVVYSEEDGVTYANYYFLDLAKQAFQIVYTEEHQENHVVLWMDVQGGSRQMLTVVMQAPTDAKGLVIERINLRTGEMESRVDARPLSDEGGSLSVWSERTDAVLDLMEDGLLASAGDQIYLIQLSTGQVVLQSSMAELAPGQRSQSADHRVLSLFPVGEYFFGFVLADGTYALGWASGSGFASTILYSGGISYCFDPVSAAFPGKQGFIKGIAENGRIRGFSAGSTADGYGFMAVTDASDPSRIRIERVAVLDKSALDTTLRVAEGKPPEPCMDGLPMLIYEDGTYLFAMREWIDGNFVYTWHWYDPGTDTVIGTYQYPGASLEAYWPLPDAHKLLITGSGRGVSCYDFETGETEDWGTEKTGDIVGTWKGQKVRLTHALSKADCAFSADGQLWTVYCDGENLSLWLNDEHRQTAALPEAVQWDLQAPVVKVGENGTVLVGDLHDGDASVMDGFALYSVRDGAWTAVEDPFHGSADRKIVMGTKENVFAVFEPDVTVHLFHADDRTESTLETGIASNGVADCRFFDGDRYLAICAKDGKLEIYDTGDGSRVFAGALPGASTCTRITAQVDHRNQRVYLIEPGCRVGLCLDAASWTLLDEMEGVCGFDETRGDLCFYDYAKGFYARHIPAMEELVRMGQSIQK